MLGTIKQLSAWTAAGILVGIGLVIWVDPTTQSGVAVLMIASILVFVVIGGIVKALFFRS